MASGVECEGKVSTEESEQTRQSGTRQTGQASQQTQYGTPGRDKRNSAVHASAKRVQKDASKQTKFSTMREGQLVGRVRCECKGGKNESKQIKSMQCGGDGASEQTNTMRRKWVQNGG